MSACNIYPKIKVNVACFISRWVGASGGLKLPDSKFYFTLWSTDKVL